MLLVVIFIFDFFFFPCQAMAANAESPDISRETATVPAADTPEVIAEEAPAPAVYTNNLPENEEIGVKWSGYYKITAYNSEIGQTDSTPCITANGFNVCEHATEDTIAANFLRFGTKVKMPELFGNRVFVVRDRMNERYGDRIDIWMADKADARAFGVKVAQIEILDTEY